MTIKNHHDLYKFDIIDFYTFVTEKLLDNSIIFAKYHTTISDQEINIFKHSRKSSLFDSNDIWIKHSDNPMFDVIMGVLMGQKYLNLLVYIY